MKFYLGIGICRKEYKYVKVLFVAVLLFIFSTACDNQPPVTSIQGADGCTADASNFIKNPLDSEVEPEYFIPPYCPDSAWFKGFARRFVLANPQEVNRFLYAQHDSAFRDYKSVYEGTLRHWLENKLADTAPEKFLEVLKELIEHLYISNTEMLMRYYPDVPKEKLLLIHINNLVHGHFGFGTQRKVCQTSRELFSLLIGDCSELALAGAIMASLFTNDAKIISFFVDYQTELGHFQAGHAIYTAGNYLFDPEVNMVITATIENILALPKSHRFTRLMEDNYIRIMYNRYLEPKKRKLQIENRNTDGGVIVFYYPWYLRGLDGDKSKIVIKQIPKRFRWIIADE